MYSPYGSVSCTHCQRQRMGTGAWVQAMALSKSYLPPVSVWQRLLGSQGQKYFVGITSALQFACLNTVANSLTPSTYPGLLWFSAWENCFHARWNHRNPGSWLGFHPDEHACVSSLLTCEPQESSSAPRPNALCSARCSCLSLKQTLFISINYLFSISWSLLILLNSVLSPLLSLYFSPSFSMLFSKPYSSVFLCSTHDFSFKYPFCKMSQPISRTQSQRRPKAAAILQILPVSANSANLTYNEVITKQDFRSLQPCL